MILSLCGRQLTMTVKTRCMHYVPTEVEHFQITLELEQKQHLDVVNNFKKSDSVCEYGERL